MFTNIPLAEVLRITASPLCNGTDFQIFLANSGVNDRLSEDQCYSEPDISFFSLFFSILFFHLLSSPLAQDKRTSLFTWFKYSQFCHFNSHLIFPLFQNSDHSSLRKFVDSQSVEQLQTIQSFENWTIGHVCIVCFDLLDALNGLQILGAIRIFAKFFWFHFNNLKYHRLMSRILEAIFTGRRLNLLLFLDSFFSFQPLERGIVTGFGRKFYSLGKRFLNEKKVKKVC